MPVSVDYVARETASNLWRNRLMTFAAVLTVAVSLSLVGASLLLKQGAAKAEFQWQRGTLVTVWMQPNASQSEVNSIGSQLKQVPYVHQPCTFRDHQYDYQEAKHLLQADEFAQLTPASVPTSWRCTPTLPQDANQVIKTFTGQPGVKTVTAPIAEIHTQEQVVNVLKWTFLGVAVILLISASVLILNTIRMAIFARRREVSVMKLVGATNWFIRIPFMSEGMTEGLIGSGVAALIVWGLHVLLDHFGSTANPNVLTQMRMSGWEVFGTDAVVVILGVLIGSAGSALAIRRFLDV